MRVVKRIKIIAEKHELKVIRFAPKVRLFCHKCQAETQHLSVAETAKMLKMSEREVFRMVESGQVHLIETVDGKLLICGDSAARFEK